MKEAKNIRVKELKIRLSPDELTELKHRQTKPELAQWAREILLSQEVQMPPPTADPKLMYELNKIGTNLNQIAREVNQGGVVNNPNELQIAVQNLEKRLREVIERCL